MKFYIYKDQRRNVDVLYEKSPAKQRFMFSF